jgi:molybdopterin-guanine dinucleotide biosynthesis protein A
MSKAQPSLDMQPGDKIHVRAGPLKGVRGAVREVIDRTVLVVPSDRPEEIHRVSADYLRNFSAAARRAWATSAKRRVGRPPARNRLRVSVTFRLDEQLWSRFKELEKTRRIKRRSEIIETFLSRFLDEADGTRK